MLLDLVWRSLRAFLDISFAEDNKEGIYLAVVPATSAPNQSRAMGLVLENKLTERTIGVITKCDRVECHEYGLLSVTLT